MSEDQKKLGGQEISKRMEDNSLLDQKREYSLIGMHAIAQLQYCLQANAEDFDQQKYLEEIDKMKTQIEIGERIIKEIESDINERKELGMTINEEIFQLKGSIQYRLDELKKIRQKLEEFLSKTPLIAQYKKDTDRYTKEILEIIDIIN